MEKTRRLLGIDLVKGIAAYGVAILHSGDVTNSITVGFWATQAQRFCGFAVPFFLIASFYLSANRTQVTGKTYSIEQRFQRLIIPYAIWSILYLLIRSIKFLLLHEPEGFEKISDITSVIFFGSAGLPLYFLPLLFIGTVSSDIATKLIRNKMTFFLLALLFLLSSIIDDVLFVTGNSFKLGENIAFENLANSLLPDGNNFFVLRIVLVFLAWSIKCFPYIFAAMIISCLLVKHELVENRNIVLLSFATFLAASLLSFTGIADLSSPIYVDFKPPTYDVVKAIPLLVFAIYLSFHLPLSPIIQSISACSFGIYLMHQIIIQVLRVPMGHFFPEFVYSVSIFSQLFFASSSFLISWFITSLLLKQRRFSKLLFGA